MWCLRYRTRLSRRPKLSRRHMLSRNSLTLTNRPTTCPPCCCRRYLEQQCVRDQDGRLISLRSGRPVTAVIPVHLYGQVADMDPILDLANEYGLTVIEDACQAHGAQYFSRKHDRWFKAGSMGRAAAFSFYPGKNLGACGEGGAVTTNDAGIAKQVRNASRPWASEKVLPRSGRLQWSSRSIQAGILRVKLTHLGRWNAERRERAATYNSLLADTLALQLPHEPSWSRAVYHLYVVRTTDRDAMIQHLNAEKIGTGIHYPIPLHLQKAYNFLNYVEGDFPLSERLAAEILSLPMFPHLSAVQQGEVARAVMAFCNKWVAKPAKGEVASLVPAEPTA